MSFLYRICGRWYQVRARRAEAASYRFKKKAEKFFQRIKRESFLTRSKEGAE